MNDPKPMGHAPDENSAASAADEPIRLDYEAPPMVEPLRLEYATPVKGPSRQRVLTVLAIIALSMFLFINFPLPPVPQLQDRIDATKADISAFAMALNAFKIDTGSFPTTAQGLGALIAQPAAVENWHGPYVSRLPADSWGTPCIYVFPGVRNKNSFDLSSAGPDMTAGTKDDIQN